ncbi:MAG: hypothetical protein HY678_08345 [Chloroflexi bacterium]|nr:hypothetical protein [Chloroflexota bacterium]
MRLTRIRILECRSFGQAVLLAIATAFAVFAFACRQPAADRTTPTGGLRLYLEDLKGGDVPAAYARLSANLQAECKLDSLKTRANEFRQRLEDASVIIRRTELSDEVAATIETTINSGDADIGIVGRRSGGGFEFTYRMRKTGEEWRLAEYGWPINWCETARPEKPVPPPLSPEPPTPEAATPSAGR